MENNISNDKEKVSFWGKLKNFFKSIFSSNKNKALNEASKLEVNPIEKSKQDFWRNVKLEEELEDKDLLELQRKYMNKEITSSELTDEQIIKLTALYNRQIERIVRKTEQIEAETEMINAKIARIKGQISEE